MGTGMQCFVSIVRNNYVIVSTPFVLNILPSHHIAHTLVLNMFVDFRKRIEKENDMDLKGMEIITFWPIRK